MCTGAEPWLLASIIGGAQVGSSVINAKAGKGPVPGSQPQPAPDYFPNMDPLAMAGLSAKSTPPTFPVQIKNPMPPPVPDDPLLKMFKPNIMNQAFAGY